MRRYFLNILATTTLGGQTYNAFIKQPACCLQAIYLLLLLTDYPVQLLQQVLLISRLYFQLYYSIIIHEAG